MDLRFGDQAHPSGGLRFGAQEYAPVDAIAGVMHAIETGTDTFAADSYPRIYGDVVAVESGSDQFAGTGSSSLLFTMQAHESPTPDDFSATGTLTRSVLRFGSQDHPSGGLRFGSPAWAALGPVGSLAVSEFGDDTAAADGWIETSPYTFAMFDVLAEFVNYGSESLGAAITGTLDTGYKIMLPVSSLSGVTFTWETNEFGSPSLRLAQVFGADVLANIPWYVWDGAAWTEALFSFSDGIQGALLAVETAHDVASFHGGETRFGSVEIVDLGEDALAAVGVVPVRGALAVSEEGIDAFAASGSPGYEGDAELVESGGDEAEILGEVLIAGDMDLSDTGEDAFAATGGAEISATLDATETGDDTLAAVGSVTLRAALAATEDDTPDTVEADGVVRVRGAVLLVEDASDVFEAGGSLERVGQVTLIESGIDVVAADGEVEVSGDLDATDVTDTFAATGTRESTGDLIAAELDAIEGGADRFVSRGRNGNLVQVPTFDRITTASGTRLVVVRSRRTAEAA
jgi:hypothetical protein